MAGRTIRTVKTAGEFSGRHPLGEADMRQWLSQPAHVLIAATLDDAPVGFALGYLLARVDESRPMLSFYEIEVAEPYRRRGIGRRLVDAMKAVARDHHALKMWVLTDSDNRQAQGLYAKTGGEPSPGPKRLYFWTDRTL